METVNYNPQVALGIYAIAFSTFAIVVGNALRSRGRVFLEHTFGTRGPVADAVHFLLNLGFYLTCGSLLLWNIAFDPTSNHGNVFAFTAKDVVQTVAARLGASVFVVSAFHTVNLLILSVLSRKNDTQ